MCNDNNKIIIITSLIMAIARAIIVKMIKKVDELDPTPIPGRASSALSLLPLH